MAAARRADLINGWRIFPQVSDTKGGGVGHRAPRIFSSEFRLKLLFSSPLLSFLLLSSLHRGLWQSGSTRAATASSCRTSITPR